MSEDVRKKLPKFSSVDEAVRFGEENDLSAYLDGMPEARFDVKLKKRLPIERELYDELDVLAHARGTTSEELANAWLREKLETEKHVR